MVTSRDGSGSADAVRRASPALVGSDSGTITSRHLHGPSGRLRAGRLVHPSGVETGARRTTPVPLSARARGARGRRRAGRPRARGATLGATRARPGVGALADV